MIPADLSALANHLWQSTLFAAAVGLLTLALRKNRAAVRYCLWLMSSVKFLIPFSLLVDLGSRFPWRSAPSIAPPQVAAVMAGIGQPFAVETAAISAVPPAHYLPAILLSVWIFGVVLGLIFWFPLFRKIRAIRRTATALHLDTPIPVASTPARSPANLEPGIFGIWNPVLILPDGIADRLTLAQFEAVLAHELCHVRRRDNLTAAVHMIVETIFWFHPPVWWIRTRLVAERERACDEEVVRIGNDPQVYAAGILGVCKYYLSSPVRCASGITGSDLKRRIESILANRSARNLSFGRRFLLLSAGCLAVAGPIAVGILGAIPGRGQSQVQTAPSAFEAASVKPNRSGGRTTRMIEPGKMTYLNITLGEFIRMAHGVSYHQISGPDWIVNAARTDRYDVIASAAGPASRQEMMPMLRALLADRFHLALHHETRKVPMYALTVAKNGPKFKSGDGGARGTRAGTGGGYSFKNWTMPDFANSLSMMAAVGRPVLDRTGLEGSYSFNAKLSDVPKSASGPEADDAALSDGVLFGALQDLGLKLEPRKDLVEFLVIDHADKTPVAN